MTQKDRQDRTMDQRAFRQALGRFATGVAIVTTRSDEGIDHGMTINSFSSVSLDPPLILWSIACSAQSYDIYANAPIFTISVLSEEQVELSNRFSRPSSEKFRDVSCLPTAAGTLAIKGALAIFECETHSRHEGGDHLIIVGRVARFSCDTGRPLVFHTGGYRSIAPLPLMQSHI